MNKVIGIGSFVLGVLALNVTYGAEIEFRWGAAAPAEPLSLWYRQPARQWVEALPVGNGRLGAMVFGGLSQERLQLNEDTLWAGGPYDPVNPDAKAALPEVRRLIFDGKYKEAHQLVGAKVLAKPLRQMPYQTVGDLTLNFPEVAVVEDYRRELNLDTAWPPSAHGRWRVHARKSSPVRWIR
jgi:alpha-L-fucosidase 2